MVERDIRPGANVKFTRMGHLVEVMHSEKVNRDCRITKIDADRYVLNETGEIFEFERTETRAQGIGALRETFKRLRYLINNNFRGSPNELHVTLTYRENMTDTERLYMDFKNFMKRLRYHYKGKSKIEYLTVVEPQQRGAWHMHVLMRFEDLESVFVPSAKLADLWGQGFVKIKSLKDVDNIGAYLSAYLADVAIDDVTTMEALQLQGADVVVRRVEGEDKRFIKGGRLWRYPTGMNLYRASRGIKMPVHEEMTYMEAKEIVGLSEPHYKKSYKVERDDFKNIVTYEQYNLKRH